MATIDRRRFRKTYAAKRFQPVYEEIQDTAEVPVIQLGSFETLTVEFNNVESAVVLCSQLYTRPVIIATPTDNVNTYVSNVYTSGNVTAIEVTSSAPFTGSVFIGVGEALN